MPARFPSPSSSSRPSMTPPPKVLAEKKKKKSNDKDKSKKSSGGKAKNEGINPHWDYAPPPGAVLVEEDEDADAGEFDWDKLNNDEDLELWLIRVPDSVKPKYLDGLKVDIPSSSRSARVGALTRKHATFDIWSVGEDDSQPVGGEEIKSLSCLLPRSSKKGRLYPSPKPIAHHLVFAAQDVTPTPDPSVDTSTEYKNPPRHRYPKEVLKHRFMPYGSFVKKNVDNEEDVTPMDVDAVEDSQHPPSPKKKRTKYADVTMTEPQSEVKMTKGKKRKGESGDAGDTPTTKKAKKAKGA